jgi:hypothetical protein
MAAAGFVLWILARVQLGSSFAVTAQAKALVTAGLYAKFRHPVYLFGGVAFTGSLWLGMRSGRCPTFCSIACFNGCGPGRRTPSWNRHTERCSANIRRGPGFSSLIRGYSRE